MNWMKANQDAKANRPINSKREFLAYRAECLYQQGAKNKQRRDTRPPKAVFSQARQYAGWIVKLNRDAATKTYCTPNQG